MLSSPAVSAKAADMSWLISRSKNSPGTACYTPTFLSIYDVFVLSFSNTYAWLCPTSTVLLPLFRASLGRRHLDVGVGTGYFPEQTLKCSVCEEITLLDLNDDVLSTAESRVRAVVGNSVKVESVKADVLEPQLPLPSVEKYDSMSLFYLIHCLPGPPSRKLFIFASLAPHLASGGQIVGATLLGEEGRMNLLARVLMGMWNRMGIFDNWADNKDDVERALREEFDDVETWTQGRVLLFRARGR